MKTLSGKTCNEALPLVRGAIALACTRGGAAGLRGGCKQGRARVAAVWRLPPLRDTVSLGVTSAHTERNLLSRCACHGLKIAVIHLRAGAAAQRRGAAKEPWAPDCGSPQATSGSETLATRR